MALIGPVSSFFQQQTPQALEMRGLDKAGLAGVQMPEMPGTTATSGVSGAAAAHAIPHLGGTGGASFGSILDNFVGDVNTKMQAGEAAQGKVLSGESTNLHQAMISMQEASTAFSLMVEVRNKMVDSYQELMRMQV